MKSVQNAGEASRHLGELATADVHANGCCTSSTTQDGKLLIGLKDASGVTRKYVVTVEAAP